MLRVPQRDEVVELGTGFIYRPDHQTDNISDPYVIIASIRYEPGTRDEGAKHWKRVTDAVDRLEKGTLSYCFVKSCEDENILFSLERYESKEYFQNVHIPSQAIAANIKVQKDIRTLGGLSHRFWKEVGNSHSG